MDPSTDPPLDLREAAAALGVHYQTAYRWVRRGRLEAELVDGRYVVTPEAVERMADLRRTPVRPPTPSVVRLERERGRMHAALLDGDEPAARAIARMLVGEGASVSELIEVVLAPALRAIGQGWHDGDVTIWAEHRSSAIVERILGELAPNPRGRRRGTVVVAAVAGDHHALPTTMAAIALRESNWNVHHLGADVPGEELERFCAEHDIDVAVLSSTNPATAGDAATVADGLRRAGTPTVVGGPGRTLDDLRDAVTDAKRAGTVVGVRARRR